MESEIVKFLLFTNECSEFSDLLLKWSEKDGFEKNQSFKTQTSSIIIKSEI